MNLDFSPVFADFGALINGAVVTVEVTAGALLLACVIGLLVGVGRLNPKRYVIYNLCSVYLLLFRGTPFLIQLFIFYYGFPQIGIRLSPIAATVIGLGLYASAYFAEIFRLSWQGVPAGQLEAARGRLVLTTTQSFAPAERGPSGDERRLGLRLYEVDVRPGVPEPRSEPNSGQKSSDLR